MACSTNSFVVTNAGSSEFNGTYTADGTQNGYTKYTKDSGTYVLFVDTGGPFRFWSLKKVAVLGYYAEAGSFGSTTECPPATMDTIVQAGPFPAVGAPTITASGGSSENTFGLPADVVALITSRFGTVANFLRLRNQGQI